MSNIIQDGQFVELTYRITDQKTGAPLSAVEFPLGYVHGHNDVLSPAVLEELEGKAAGDIIEVPIDCNQLYGPRDESLVFTDALENVPPDYRELGTTITMQSETGKTRDFIVTAMDDKTLTIDGNNPLSGRHVLFRLEVLSVRPATSQEIEAGGAPDRGDDIDDALKIPL